MQFITEFHIYESLHLPGAIVIAIPKDNGLFRCWDIRNSPEGILRTSNQLLTDPNFGCFTGLTGLGPLIAVYTIQSHPEYFL